MELQERLCVCDAACGREDLGNCCDDAFRGWRIAWSGDGLGPSGIGEGCGGGGEGDAGGCCVGGERRWVSDLGRRWCLLGFESGYGLLGRVKTVGEVTVVTVVTV